MICCLFTLVFVLYVFFLFSVVFLFFFFFKQKTAYEMRISDWSSDCALPIFRRAASTLARLPLIFSDHLVPLHSEVCASFSNDASYAVLSGDHERGFNACVELCDRHVGSEIGRASCRERVCQYV